MILGANRKPPPQEIALITFNAHLRFSIKGAAFEEETVDLKNFPTSFIL